MTEATDLQSYLDEHGQLRAGVARHLAAVVTAATSHPVGRRVLTAVGCPCRREGKACRGRLYVVGVEEGEVVWECSECETSGRVCGWEGTDFDRRAARRAREGQATCRIFLTAWGLEELRKLTVLSADSRALLDAACWDPQRDRAVVEGTAAELRELRRELYRLLAAPGTEAKLPSRRQRALEQACDELDRVLEAARAGADRPVLSLRAGQAAAERALRAIDRAMRGREFATREEASAFLKGLLEGRSLPEVPPETALEEAQELVYRAWETDDPAEQVRLAREALKISPDCADAWVILGEAAGSLDEAIRCFTEGVRAGERALGAQLFEEAVGRFWGVVETRPYMRARFALAQALDQAGRTAEAVQHGLELLRLTPDDNQGVRYALVHWLLEEGRLSEAEALLGRYEEDSAGWLYARALLKFMQEGDSPAARRAVAEAVFNNPHVVLVLGEDLAHTEVPEGFTPGGRDEALVYWSEAMYAWFSVDGAVEWLVNTAAEVAMAAQRSLVRKVGRNDPCPCGSGRKYKHCCLQLLQ
jgi:tetratricopeptide (TPR) repeat protein